MNTPCINWTGAQNGTGYGYRTVKGKSWLAHRYAYTQTFGEIPKGLLVRHKCDNKLCVNPEHLELGTKTDNALDAVVRGQIPLGSKRKQSKLTEDSVRIIRMDTQSTHASLALRFGVKRTVITNIKNRKAWKHVE